MKIQLLLSIILFATCVTTVNGEEPVKLEHPELSVPTYSLLRKLNGSLDLRELDEKISAASDDGLSDVDAVLFASNELGTPLCFSRKQPAEPSAIRIPSLILITKSGKEWSDGALLLVEAKSDDAVQVYDYASGQGSGFVAYSDLSLVWLGDVIEIDKQTFRKRIILVFLLSTGLVLLLFKLIRNRRTSILALLVLGSCIAGCQKSEMAVHSPIANVSNKPFAELGVVGEDGSRNAEFSIPLHVVWDGPVRIKKITGNCSCLGVGDELIGKELEPNNEFLLHGMIRINDKVGDKRLIVTIHTSDETGNLPPSKIGLNFIVFPRPRSKFSNVRLKAFEGEANFTGSVSMILIRQESDRELEWDSSLKQEHDFSLSITRSETGQKLKGGKLFRDFIELNVIAPSDIDRDLGSSVLLKAKEYDSIIEIPVTYELKKHLTPMPEQLFLGLVDSDTTIEKTVYLQCESINLLALSNPKITNDRNTKIIEAAISDGKFRIDFEFTPSGPTGRTNKIIEVEFQNGLSFSLPYSVILK